MGKKRSEIAFWQRLIQPSQLYRNVIKPARCKPAIEVPWSRHDHPDYRNSDVGPCLIENEKVETRARGDLDAGVYLRTRIVELCEFREGAGVDRPFVIWEQEALVFKVQRGRAI